MYKATKTLIRFSNLTPQHPLFSLSSYWQQLPRFSRVLSTARAGKPKLPHILVLNPTMPTDTSVDHLPCSCNIPKDPQPTLQGRKWGRRDHGLTQHSFLCGRTEGKDLTQAAAPCSPKMQQEQSSIPPAAQDQGHGERSLWTNPLSASTSMRRFLSSAGGRCADSHTSPASVFPTLKTGIPARTWRVGQHPCVTHARCVNPWKKKGWVSSLSLKTVRFRTAAPCQNPSL